MIYFSPEAQRRILDLLKFCAGDFQIVAYYTDTIRAREQLPGFPFPDRAPGQAIGFRCSYSTIAYALPTGDPDVKGPVRAKITPATMNDMKWMTVVEPRAAVDALTAMLKFAQYKLARARMHHTSRGYIA